MKKKRAAYNAIQWTTEMDQFLIENHPHMNNRELAEALHLTLTVTRTRCYSMGLYRMRLEYWNGEQTCFLKANYHKIGDAELSDIFNEKWKKEKGWTKKHIEKKRRYLNLKRTEAEKIAIYHRNKKNGRWAICPVKAWKVRGISEEGTIRIWKLNGYHAKFRKTGGKWIKLAHYNWIEARGGMPKNLNIIHKDRDTMNCDISNLEAISDVALAIRNNASITLSDKYIAGILTRNNKALRKAVLAERNLIELKRQSLILNRKINERTQKKNA